MKGRRLAAIATRILLVVGLGAGSPALLAHPPAPGSGHPGSKGAAVPMPIYLAPGHYFTDQQREQVRSFYARRFRHGRCPPGLAKKHDGCMPPGQLPQWKLGQPLPEGLTAYPVSQKLTSMLGQPPRGYRYVRVANDLLVIASASRVVVDAIQDIASGD